MQKFIGSVISFSFFLLSLNPASASKGGVEQLNNQFVVGFTFKDKEIPSLCNGALIAPNILATARHCVIDRDGVYGTNYVFSAPGAKLDAYIDAKTVPTKVKQFIIPQQTPIQGIDRRLDLAFIVTETPFTTGKPISIATQSELSQLNSGSEIIGYGYGEIFETGANFSSFPRSFALSWGGSYLVEGTNSLFELLSENNVACEGDSGGPITWKRSDGSEVLLGVISVAGEVQNGCGTKAPDGLYHMRMSGITPYISQIPKPIVTPAPKIKRIVCIKGTAKKIIKAVNPKCPKGYKLKK